MAVAAQGKFPEHPWGMGRAVTVLAPGDRAVFAFVAGHAFLGFMPGFSRAQVVQGDAMAGSAGRGRGVLGKIHGNHRHRRMGKLMAHFTAALDRSLGRVRRMAFDTGGNRTVIAFVAENATQIFMEGLAGRQGFVNLGMAARAVL